MLPAGPFWVIGVPCARQPTVAEWTLALEAARQAAVNALCGLLLAKYATQAKILGCAFHTSMMQPAQDKLGKVLDEGHRLINNGPPHLGHRLQAPNRTILRCQTVKQSLRGL